MQHLVRALFVVLLCLTITERASTQDFQTVNMMFYVMADNSDGCVAIDAVTQLASVAGALSTSKISLFWQRSTNPFHCGDQTVLGQAPWTGAKIFQVTANTLTVTSDLGVVDAASASVLGNFISSAGSSFSADQYLLIFFGPGSYFSFGSQDSQNRSQTYWSYLDLAPAVNNAVRGLNLPRGKLDFLFLDASFSASQENFQMFSPAAFTIAGFQSVQPRPDYTYWSLSSNIPKGTVLTRAAIQAIGQTYYNLLVQKNPGLPVLSYTMVDTSLIANVTEAFDTFSRAFRLLPQRTFADVRRNMVEVDPAPFPFTENSAVDLGYLSYWMTYYRRFPFLQKGWGPALTKALDNAVVFYGRGDALAGATGVSVFFPLTNSSDNYYATTHFYRLYDFNFAWYSFVLAFLFTPHDEFFFVTPRISVNPDGTYNLYVNTTLDSVVQANLLFGVETIQDDYAGNVLIISGSTRLSIANFTEANNLIGKWDGNVFRITNTNFFPFVQALKSAYLISFVVFNPVNNLPYAVKGYFYADSTVATNFYISDGPHTCPFHLKPGSTIYFATTQPFLLDYNQFYGSEVALKDPTFNTTADNQIQLEKVRFTNVAGEDNGYVFLTTRNIDDSFGFAGWRIPVSDPTAVYLLNDQNRLLTNFTVNLVQVVSPGKTKLKIAFRNTGNRDATINYMIVYGLPAGLTNAIVRPPGYCRPTNASFAALKCLVDFIPARSFAKISVIFPQAIYTPLTAVASGDHFTPRNVTARVVVKNRSQTRGVLRRSLSATYRRPSPSRTSRAAG